MRRAFVYADHGEEGMVIPVSGSVLDFQKLCATWFEGLASEAENIRIYLANGCEVVDADVIRDNETLYITSKDQYNPVAAAEHIQKRLESMKKESTNEVVSSTDVVNTDWITLNIGGRHFTTSKSTILVKEPLSMLARMFAGDGQGYMMTPSAQDATGAFLIDRSPDYFEPVLNYLRHGVIILDKNVNPKGVLEEARFYGIESMVPALQHLLVCGQQQEQHAALTRRDVVRALVGTPTGAELRFQGVNLTGADLSRLDLRNINFKYACLSRCNLSGANLSHCCLERADLSAANLDAAQLLGVKALCANMEGANLKGCNMEDPAGSRAIMEGVNLKGANLEGSNMAGVNLRVATLKNANLQNCDLRAAVLAGADLECCDLSGSDLHEANLRGANLKDAAFELMLTPLHMSQTIR